MKNLPLPRSLESAQKALNRAENAYARLWRKLDRELKRDLCRGDLFRSWDWPTLHAVRPDEYYTLKGYIAQAKRAAGAIRFYSVEPVAPLEFAQ